MYFMQFHFPLKIMNNDIYIYIYFNIKKYSFEIYFIVIFYYIYNINL